MLVGQTIPRPSASILALLVSLLASDASQALSGEEHQLISRAALRLACLSEGLGIDCSDPEGRLPETDRRALAPLAADREPGHLSYAELVVYVDFIDDPEKLLHATASRGVPGSPCSQQDLDIDFLWRLPGRPTAKAHALRNDASHFQHHLLHSAWSWHKAALDEAKEARASKGSRCLYAALLKSAVAAHFVEDFFAPGHVTAPRDGYPDYAANTLHDRYNHRGRVFEVHAARAAELFESLLIAVKKIEGTREGDELFADLGLKASEVVKILGSRVVDPKGDHRVLFRGDRDVLQPSRFGVRGPQEGGRPIPHQDPTTYDNERVSSPRRGSDTEYSCPDSRCADESKAQRVLAVFTVARAIEEVLSAYTGRRSLQSVLERYEWRDMRLAERGPLGTNVFAKVDLPTGELPIGSYEPVECTRLRYGMMGSFDVGWQTLFEGSEERARGTAGFEWFPGIAPPGLDVEGTLVPSFATFALALGGSYRFDEGDASPAASLTGYVLLPKVDLQFGLSARFARFAIPGGSTIRFVPEVRMMKTLSFVGIYLGAAYDYRELDDGALDRSLAVTSGFQFALPWWRLGRWLNGCCGGRCSQPPCGDR